MKGCLLLYLLKEVVLQLICFRDRKVSCRPSSILGQYVFLLIAQIMNRHTQYARFHTQRMDRGAVFKHETENYKEFRY